MSPIRIIRVLFLFAVLSILGCAGLERTLTPTNRQEVLIKSANTGEIMNLITDKMEAKGFYMDPTPSSRLSFIKVLTNDVGKYAKNETDYASVKNPKMEVVFVVDRTREGTSVVCLSAISSEMAGGGRRVDAEISDSWFEEMNNLLLRVKEAVEPA